MLLFYTQQEDPFVHMILAQLLASTVQDIEYEVSN